MADAWTWSEYDAIRKRFPKEGADMVGALNNRSVSALRSRAVKLNTTEHIEFTQDEIDTAKKFGSCMNKALIFLLPDRAPCEIEELLNCAK